MSDKYKYYAFISYKREDEKWAKWLHKKLESYGFPVALRKENPSLPAKIRPIFRDQSELSGWNLKEEIEKGLEESQYLIVICSPRAAQSPWVSKEVQYFIDNGRENKIIPFIIGGSPNAANPEDECFPEGLRQLSGEKEILGININEMGRDAAAIKVIAHMFNLRFDTLWQRHERAKRRRRIAVITAMALFALISFGIGAYMTYLNTQIAAERDRSEQQTEIAKKERNRANNERDNALKANKALAQTKDSIQLQSNFISQINRILEETNLKLEESNRLLIEERDAKEQAYLSATKNNIRLRMTLANQRLENGDALLPSLLALDVLTNDSLPYMPEAEGVLRNAMGSNSAVIDAFSTTPRESKFSNNGEYIISSAEKLKIYNADNGALVRTLPFNNASIKIDRNKVFLADCYGTDYCNVYELDKDWNPVSIHHFDKPISGFVDNSNYVVSYSISEATLFDMFSGDSITTIKNKDISKIRCSNNGKFLIAALNDSIIGIWNSKTGEMIRELKGHESKKYFDLSVCAMFNKNDSIIYSWSADKTVRKWSATSGECLDTLFFPSPVISTALDRDEDYLYSALGNGEIHRYNLKTNKVLNPLIGHTAQVNHIAINTYGYQLVSSGNDGTIRLWGGFKNDEKYRKLYGPKSFGQDIVFCPQKGVGKDYVFIALDDSIIYNGNFRGHRREINSVKFSEDGRSILSASADSTIRIWQNSISKKKRLEIRRLTDCHGAVYDAEFIFDNRILSISGDGKFRIWSVNKGMCIDSIDATNIFTKRFLKTSRPKHLRISDDKKYAYILGNKIYKFDIGKKVCIDSIGHRGVSAYNINFDNSKIVYSIADTLWIRDNVLGRTSIKMVPNSNHIITDVQFSHDGRYLLLAYFEDNVEVRDVESGVLIKKYNGTWPALHASFSPLDDKVAVTGGYFIDSQPDNSNYTAILDFTPLDNLIERQRRRFKNRRLSSEEKRKYYLE